MESMPLNMKFAETSVNGSHGSSPTQTYENGKVDMMNTQDYKNSSAAISKTDGPAKSFCNNLNSSIGKNNSQLVNRSFEKSRNSDNSYDLGVTQDSIDGTDSGVEMIRALSSNGSNSDRFTPIQSCGSSLMSYSSEPEVDRGSDCGSESSEKSRVRKSSDCGDHQRSSNCWKIKKTYAKTERSRTSNRKANYEGEGEGTSESCSETSSTHESVTPDQLNRSIDFKRCASSRSHEVKKCENGKLSMVRRSDSSTRHSSYDKTSARSHSGVRGSSSASKVNSGSKSLSLSRNVKSNISGKSDVKGARTESGRWSTPRDQTNGARIRVSSVADPSRKNSLTPMSSSMTSSFTGGIVKNGTYEMKSNALDKYGTLPRRPKKKPTDLLTASVMSTSLTRSNSVTREPSLNRAATLRRQQSREKENCSGGKTLPPYPRTKRSTGKTLIYHEVSVQTIITSEDISCTSTGVSIRGTGEGVMEKSSKGIQTEGKERLKKIEDDYMKQQEELERVRKENEELKAEKKSVISRIYKLLGHGELKEEEEVKENGLDELEQHFQAVGLTVLKQQEELSELRHYKLIAHRDLEKSLAAQKNLLQQQQEIEDEYSELQEFLQAEKTALSESLTDTEEQLNRLRLEISKKNSLLEEQQEECKHLVRLCEQRRQENLSLEAKLAGLDQRSRDVLVQQGAAVSAAAVALSGLGARLDTLVEQLAVSCNITEKDLEDIIYHNEAYSQSEDNSPDDVPSTPQITDCGKRESFLQIILGAIRNATQSPLASAKKYVASKKASGQTSESLAFFDAETEPCLSFEAAMDENSSSLSNGVEYGNQVESTKKEKEETSTTSSHSEYENSLSRSDSLQNLSDAILNRQMVEKNERNVSLDEIIPIEVNSLVDQIIDVDNLVTKLLKVIRIIQRESEMCLEELQSERTNLTGQLLQEKVTRQKLEGNLKRLQHELSEARSQLNTRITQLEEVKALCGESQRVAVVEMQKRFAIIGTALGALNSVQDVVNQCPPLARLRQDLEDCSYQKTPNSDVNANSATNENGLLEDVKHNGAVLTTAI